MSLFLADFSGLSSSQLLKKVAADYNIDVKELKQYQFIIAYQSEGSYGCDSSSYFLLRHKTSKLFYEVRGSHCSCFGFEGQFDPESTPVEYLKSDRFTVPFTGGYDDEAKDNIQKIIRRIKRIK